MRNRYVVPDSAIDAERVSLVEHARNKLLYHELAPLYALAVAGKTETEADCVETAIRRVDESANTLVDFGCGIGRHSQALSARGFQVVGVDLSEDMLKQARLRCDSVEFVQGDFRTVRLGRLFDAAIVMWTTFNYLSTDLDLEQFFETAELHLKPGGVLLIDVKNYSGLEAQKYERRSGDDNFDVKVVINKEIRNGLNIATYEYSVGDKAGHSVDHHVDQEVAKVYSEEAIIEAARARFQWVTSYSDYELSTDPLGPRIVSLFVKRGIVQEPQGGVERLRGGQG